MFDQRSSLLIRIHDDNEALLKDMGHLLFIIIPLFIFGLRFWTAPVYLNYRMRFNSFVAPLALLPIFFSHSWDIVILGVVVLWMNIYVFVYHIDPPQNLQNF